MPTRRLLLAATVLALILPTAAQAAPTAVDVRVEGRSSTIFAGPVTTDGKVVTPATGANHLCDGTNNGANPLPGPTPTAALHDAAIKGGFGWDADWFGPDFPDYAITRVADEPATESEFWGVFVDGVAPSVGGCQVLLSPGNEVLWAFDAFSKTGVLALAAPAVAQTGTPIQASVTDTATGEPISDATVGSSTTGSDGTATLSFDEPGIYALRAEHPTYVRSAVTRVCVDPPLVEACTSADRTPPSVQLDVPAIASLTDRLGRVRLSWQGDDADGSGIRRYRVAKRRLDVPDAPWQPVATDTTSTLAHVATEPGSEYAFRVQAFDRAGNASGYAARTSLMPLDNLNPDLKLSKKGWRTLRRGRAWERSVVRATAKGALAKLSFTGRQVTIVTREMKRGGRMRVTVDGKSRLVKLRGDEGFRQTLVQSRALEAGEHTLRVKSVGRNPIEIDAIAILP